LPTPVIGMVGLIEDARRILQPGFKHEGDLVALLGTTNDDLSISEYAATILGRTTAEMTTRGRVPVLDLQRERAVQEVCLRAMEEGLLRSAHDCADGGLAVTLAESCFSSLGRRGLGADVQLNGALAPAIQLFSESPSRIVVSFDPAAHARLAEIAAELDCPCAVIGRVGGPQLRISVNGAGTIAHDLNELEAAWRNALGRRLQVEALAAAAE